MPWERRHRRLIERMGFFLAIGGAVVILTVVMTYLHMMSVSSMH